MCELSLLVNLFSSFRSQKAGVLTKFEVADLNSVTDCINKRTLGSFFWEGVGGGGNLRSICGTVTSKSSETVTSNFQLFLSRMDDARLIF